MSAATGDRGNDWERSRDGVVMATASSRGGYADRGVGARSGFDKKEKGAINL